MKKKHPHYKNPTIIEAVLEILFTSCLVPAETQKLQNILEAQFECKKEELVTYTATVQPSGLSMKADKPGQMRLVLTLGSNTYARLHADKLSFHWVGKYPGWDTFSEKLKEFLGFLSKASFDMTSQRIGVRFINKLDKKTTQEKVGFWLEPSPNYPENILSARSDYFYRCKWPAPSGKLIQICIAEVESANHFRPLIFDIDVIQLIDKPLKLEEIINISSALHDDLYDIFESSISPYYKKFLNEDFGV